MDADHLVPGCEQAVIGRPRGARTRASLSGLVRWCVAERGVALSSMRVDDCEAYKALLAAPGERFRPPVARTSGRWRRTK
ncbi:integrase [Burkholderia pseudomallei]|nr:integrase [Burkholderia pseudomallei]KIX50721.1 integrase [Burkholderia pseudomallei]KJR91703.1 integrase [Burkholderia pseudomallei]OAB06818.1 integrase [Burkholderia pseudomallei]OMR31654.1 integrase [Burkholderia pseudomallei]